MSLKGIGLLVAKACRARPCLFPCLFTVLFAPFRGQHLATAGIYMEHARYSSYLNNLRQEINKKGAFTKTEYTDSTKALSAIRSIFTTN